MAKSNSRFVDITGQTFGHLTAVRFVGYTPTGSKQLWEFSCALCDSLTVKKSNQVRAGTARGAFPSCGCNQFGHGNRKHGKHGTHEYRVWKGMRQRCNDQNAQNYHDYGGRGIKVCPRWDDFATFLADMGPAPTPKHTIERRNNDGPYQPSNCVWATRAKQSRNTRQNVNLTHQGKTLCVYDWAAELGLKPTTIFTRLQRGATVEQALSTTIQKQSSRLITYLGETLSAKEWSRRTGIPYPTVLWRLRKGLPPEEILRQ